MLEDRKSGGRKEGTETVRVSLLVPSLPAAAKKCKIIILFYTFANGLAKKSERTFGISCRPAA
jgi:hypothetical protein